VDRALVQAIIRLNFITTTGYISQQRRHARRPRFLQQQRSGRQCLRVLRLGERRRGRRIVPSLTTLADFLDAACLHTTYVPASKYHVQSYERLSMLLPGFVFIDITEERYVHPSSRFDEAKP